MSFSKFILEDKAESIITEKKDRFVMPLKWDNEEAIISIEYEDDSDNYKVSVNTPVGMGSYYIDMENDGEIVNIKNPKVIASMLNNFILLSPKKPKHPKQ